MIAWALVLILIVAIGDEKNYNDFRLVTIQMLLVGLGCLEVVTLDFCLYNCQMGFC